MYRKSNLLFLMNSTPLHAGSGDSLGIVDIPIQREKHTGFPKIEASSLKGSIREHFERATEKKEKDPEIIAAFGYEGENNNNSQAGALGFTDARLLLFPVKSMKGVFAWITCPAIISKFNEELKLSGFDKQFNVKENTVSPGKTLVLNSINIILEEYTFKVEENNGVAEMGKWLSEKLFNNNSHFANKLETDIVVLKNDDFKDFVNLSTEVITRTQIDNDTGTVKDGALFTEEYLPAESVMYSLVLTAPEFTKEKDDSKKAFASEEKLKTFFKNFINNNSVMQIGGNATLGKGITKAVFVEPENNGGK